MILCKENSKISVYVCDYSSRYKLNVSIICEGKFHWYGHYPQVNTHLNVNIFSDEYYSNYYINVTWLEDYVSSMDHYVKAWHGMMQGLFNKTLNKIKNHEITCL